jgi:hypothetical protein
MEQLINLIARVINAILNKRNQQAKADATDNPADTIANGGRVQQSSKSFEELASEFERDRAE